MTKGMGSKEVLALIKDKHIRAVDIRFCDLFGQWQHFTLPSTMVGESSFTDGHGFDGSSIRGWKSIDESDMLVVPDPDTAVIDPFFAEPTLVMIANVVDPMTKEGYELDPGIDQELMIDLLVAPMWTRLLITREPITKPFVDDIVDAVIRAFPPPTEAAAPPDERLGDHR